MKRIIPLVLFCFCIGIAKAQDVIIKNDKKEIKAKVMEVAEDVIKYKEWEFQDGPTYSVRKNEVFMILYKNGKRETFESSAPAASQTVPVAAPKKQTNATPQPTQSSTTTSPQQQPERAVSTPTKERAAKPALMGSGSLFSLSDLKITAGLTFGDASFTTSSSAKTPDFSPLIGYMIGVAKELPIAENISIQPGIAFVGWGISYSSVNVSYFINYLSLEGIARYKTPFGLYAGAGAYTDFGLFGTQTYSSGNTVSPFDDDGLTRLNLGLAFEAGYPLTIANKNTEIFGSYRYGLNNVEGEDAPSGQTTKFQMLTLGLRYIL